MWPRTHLRQYSCKSILPHTVGPDPPECGASKLTLRAELRLHGCPGLNRASDIKGHKTKLPLFDDLGMNINFSHEVKLGLVSEMSKLDYSVKHPHTAFFSYL